MGKRLSIKDQHAFLESVNTLLQNGFSIKEAMNLMRQLQPKTGVITKILKQLTAGCSFAQSITGYFPQNIVNQIQIAEQHGQLKATLNEVQRFVMAQTKYQNKLKAILIYPLFLICLLMVIIVGINLFVMPQLSMIGHAKNATGGIRLLWWGLLIGLLLAGLASYLWYRQQNKLTQIEILARLPIIGLLVQNYYAYYLASNVALLLTSGLEAKSIAHLMCQFPTNSVLNSLGNELTIVIQSQGSIKQLIERHYFIPNETMLFFGRGDSVIEIGKKLSGYAQMAFNRMWMRFQRLIGIIQPLIFLVIGAIIVTTYLQMLLPMYDTLSEVYD